MSSPLRAALWMVVSALAASGMNFAVRGLGTDMSGAAIAFWRMAVGSLLFVTPPLLMAAWRRGQGESSGQGLRFTRPWRHVLRGVLIGISTVGGFEALTRMPLTAATALFFLAPIFVTAFSALFGLEKVGKWRWLATAAGFLGALVILRPTDEGGIGFGALMAVMSSATFAAALMVGRPLSREDGAFSVMVSSNLVGALAALPVALTAWSLPTGWTLWAILLAAVLAGSLRSFADIKAYDLGDAGFVAPFSFLRLIFVAIGAWLIFGETPDGPTWLGAALIVGASVAIAIREARKKRPPSRSGLST